MIRLLSTAKSFLVGMENRGSLQTNLHSLPFYEMQRAEEGVGIRLISSLPKQKFVISAPLPRELGTPVCPECPTPPGSRLVSDDKDSGTGVSRSEELAAPLLQGQGHLGVDDLFWATVPGTWVTCLSRELILFPGIFSLALTDIPCGAPEG